MDILNNYSRQVTRSTKDQHILVGNIVGAVAFTYLSKAMSQLMTQSVLLEPAQDEAVWLECYLRILSKM